MFSLYPLEYESPKQNCHERDRERWCEGVKRGFKDPKLDEKEFFPFCKGLIDALFNLLLKTLSPMFSLYTLEYEPNKRNYHEKDREHWCEGVKMGFKDTKLDEKKFFPFCKGLIDALFNLLLKTLSPMFSVYPLGYEPNKRNCQEKDREHWRKRVRRWRENPKLDEKNSSHSATD